MANSRFTQFFYTKNTMPMQIDCRFTVAATDTAGKGITGLVGRGISNVYMHTSATPATGNPNPANGIIIVQFQDNYKQFLGMDFSVQAPLSASDVTTTVASTSYVITTVGSTTLAQWQAVGVPKGVSPAVGVAFTATASQAIGGTGAVQVIASAGAGLDHVEVFGSPTTTINPSITYASPATVGAPQILLQCFKEHVVSAPAAGAVIGLKFLFSNSSVSYSGE